MVALDKDLAGLFGYAAAVVLGHRVERPGDVVIPQQVLHQILRHGGEAVGVVDVLVIVVAVEELDLVAASIEHDAGLVEQYFPDNALLQPGGAALGGAFGGQGALIQRDALRVELFSAALADLKQDIAHHAAFQQRADAFLRAGLFGFCLDGVDQAHRAPPCENGRYTYSIPCFAPQWQQAGL